MAYANVNLHGQITLPAPIRERHGISAGSTVNIEERGDEIVISKATVIEEKLLKEIAELAEKKGVTKEQIVTAVKKIGERIYEKELTS